MKVEMEYEMDELLPVITWLTERYTSKESTSVTYEKARQLMEAILYCMEQNHVREGEDTTSFPVTADRPDAKQAYDSGYELVLKKTIQTKHLYESMLLEFDDYGNRALHDTVIKDIPGFFRFYDARYHPHNHIITMDYPVLEPMNEGCGINVIQRYLMCIKWEQQFLSPFPQQYVKEALERYHSNYQDLFINVASVVLRDSLTLLFTGKQPTKEEVGNMGAMKFDFVREYVMRDSLPELEEQLNQLLTQLVQSRYGGEEGLLHYLKQDIHPFVTEASVDAGLV